MLIYNKMKENLFFSFDVISLIKCWYEGKFFYRFMKRKKNPLLISLSFTNKNQISKFYFQRLVYRTLWACYLRDGLARFSTSNLGPPIHGLKQFWIYIYFRIREEILFDLTTKIDSTLCRIVWNSSKKLSCLLHAIRHSAANWHSAESTHIGEFLCEFATICNNILTR
jgi:hypothetical protein